MAAAQDQLQSQKLCFYNRETFIQKILVSSFQTLGLVWYSLTDPRPSVIYSIYLYIDIITIYL